MDVDAEDTDTRTVGVALPVPEPWGGELQQARIALGDVRARHIPTHITLLPPTPVPSSTLVAMREHLTGVAGHHPEFPVVLRGTGTFRPVSDVVFIQVARGLASCEVLERRVRGGPIRRDLQFPYHPHVTVAHDVDAAALDRAFDTLADFTCSFTARQVRLYVHDGDGVWRRDSDYELTGDDAEPGL